MNTKLSGLLTGALLSLSLAACAGGGGGGGDSTATPPTASLPDNPTTPTYALVDPTVTGYSDSAPASYGTNVTPAVEATSNTTPHLLDAPDNTNFRLLQSTAQFSPTGTTANAAVDTVGSSITLVSTSNSDNTVVSVGGVDNYPLALTGGSTASGHVELDGTAGTNKSSADLNFLNWMAYGNWAVTNAAETSGTIGYFSTGYETPVASLPTTGTGHYTGAMTGTAFNNTGTYNLAGTSDLVVNWSDASVTGSLTGITATQNSTSQAWNDIGFTGNMSGSGFSGATSATSLPGGTASVGAAATGSVAGQFYGPNAEEVGGAWNISDGVTSAVGSFGAH